ncbi:MAG TPA: CHAT domain-containing protein, partial [Ktedonobacteraceae bacterium]|nr:CHAT domain-containing protein [Ktedonobacteraceae bacterium]
LEGNQANILNLLGIVDKYRHPKQNTHQHLGRWIGKALRNNAIVNKYLQDLFKKARGAGGGEIVFSFNQDALQLAAIPWELAYYDDSNPLFLYLGREIPLGCTRMIAHEFQESKIHDVGEKMQLLAVSSYVEMGDQDRKLEQQARQALKKAVRLNDVSVASVEHVSMSKLQAALYANPPLDILDYWGHGDFKNGCTVLLMEDDSGQRTEIDPPKLTNLGGLPSVVVLHACHTAHIDILKTYGSLALELNRVGVKAVVAMQLAIRMQDITEMIVPILYKELAERHSIQRSLAQVRKELYINAKEGVSWYVPVLYVQHNSPYLPYIPFERASPVTNPFFFGRSSATTQSFIGRRIEVHKMWDQLSKNASFAIVGPEGTGKTSMLHLIQGEGQAKLKFDKPTRIVWLDILDDMKVVDAKQEVVDQLGGQKPGELDRLLRKNHVILLVNNLSILDPKPGSRAQQLLNWLNSLLKDVQLVAEIRPPVENLFPTGTTSLYEVAKMPIELGAFKPEDARGFISERLADTGFDITDFECLLTGEKTPRELRMACYNRFEDLLKCGQGDV